ncbi:hypothetical protein PCASD_06498 [Puccinia coronata f. sp. avenae]|uniref:Tet-like 2OG-Fe(II) oxygenase domain-containing protein n=2 Tax=Puccinia coronata f. sp. avenae TaxID=200324 RepID=A0A2N5V1T0_9BASI|nr:hypothetical protein PCASD_06498 [Puccinia coronata f. sp. avenae]
MAVRLGWGKNNRLVKFSRTWPWNPCLLKQSSSLCRFRVRGAILSTRGVLSSPNFCQDCEVRLPLAPAAGEQAGQRRPGLAPGRGLGPICLSVPSIKFLIDFLILVCSSPRLVYFHPEEPRFSYNVFPKKLAGLLLQISKFAFAKKREIYLSQNICFSTRFSLGYSSRFTKPYSFAICAAKCNQRTPLDTHPRAEQTIRFARPPSSWLLALACSSGNSRWSAQIHLSYIFASLSCPPARPIASNSAPALLPAVASRHLASSPPSPCLPLSSSLIGASPAPNSDNLMALSPVDTSTAPSYRQKYFVPQHKTRANPAPQTQTTSSYKNSSNKASGRKRKSRKALEESARIQAALGMSKQSVIWHQVKSTPHNLYPNIPWKDGNPTRRPTNSEIQLAYNKVNQFRPLTSGLNIIKEKKEVIAIVEFTPFSELNRSQIDDLNYVSNFLHASKRFINSVSSCSRVWAGLMWAVGWHPSKTIKIL